MCTAIECPPPPSISYGMTSFTPDITANFSLGTVATYSCITGFFLDLSEGEVRTCMEDGGADAIGMWSDDPPTCVRKSCS